MIIVKNVFKKFKENFVLQDVSFELKEKDVLGIAGPSGCGKSTMLRCINGFEDLDQGSIKCFGKIGFMFQDFQLFPHMNVYQNLTYASNLLGFHSDEKVKTLLKDLGIESKQQNYPNFLSGGQKQRVALARSLMIDPDIFLCDEPTSGLDVATIDDVVILLKSIKVKSILIASHDLDFLMKITNRIIVLNKGRVAQDILTKDTDIKELKSYYL